MKRFLQINAIIASILCLVGGLESKAQTTVINFDNATNWTGSGALTSYSSGHTYVSNNWTFTGGPALREATASQDGFPGFLGTYAWRMQNSSTGSFTGTYNIAGTISAVGFKYRRWDNSPALNHTFEYSTNGGSSWTNITTVTVPPSSDWQTVSHTLASAAVVTANQFIFRVTWTTPTPERMMFDDFSFTLSTACAAPSTQASAFTFNTITGTSMNVNWTNGNGAGRVVYMNTSNSFTAPTDGSNPGASTTYGGGQQCIFNGTGSGPISISGLTSSTTYWFRVYEYCSPDRTYNTSTATDNPLSQATTASSITSATNGDWFTGSTWVGGVVPSSSDNVTIVHNVTSAGAITRNSGTFTTVAIGSSLAVAATYTNNGTTTINGTFQLNSGGWATGNDFVYGATSTLNFNNSTSYGVSNTDKFWPAASLPFNVGVLQGGLTLNSANRSVAGVFSTAAGVTLNSSTLTLSGTCRIDNGGFFNQSPTYSGASSILIYNTGAGFGTGNEWTGGGSTTPTVGVGVPGNVTIQTASTNVTLAGARGIPGNLTVNASTTFTLNSGSGDFFIGGNLTQNGTLINNNRAVQFVQSAATQTISASAGNIFFDYLLINKPSGTVQLSATDVTINTTAGDVLQLLNAGTLDLNGRTLNLNNANGNILASGGSRAINSSLTGAIININGYKTFTFGGGGSMTLSPNITVRLNAAGVDFGASTTLNGTLQINFNGFVNTAGAPFYGAASLLQYNSGTNYGRGNEWISNVAAAKGYPYNVQISGNTNLIPGANAGTNTSWEAGGNLTIDAGSGFYLDFGTDDMNVPIRILGNITSAGGLSLSDNSGGDLKVRGNISFTTGYTFNPKSRAVFFTKNGTQTISSSNVTTTFHYIVFEPVSGSTTIQLSGTDVDVTAPSTGNAISFSSASDVFDLNGRTLRIGTSGLTNSISGAGTFKGSTASNITLFGNGSVGTLNFTTGSQVLGTLTIDRQAGQVAATLGTPLNLNNALFLTNGILGLGNNNLTINASASITGGSANSFVAADELVGTGELRKTFTANGSFTFPVGDISAPDGNQYSPATLNFTAGTYSSAYAGIKVRDAIHPSNPTGTPAITRYWSVTSSGITSPTYSFTSTYTSADIVGVEASSFSARWNGTTWTQAGSLSANTISVTGNTTLPATNQFTGGVVICAAPSNATALTFSGATSGTIDLGWTNGGGAGRVIIFNSADVFTAPTTGSNPAASLAYASGQQVVFNGTGSGPITITGLNPLTTYYARVYEYCSPDRVYATGTASSNGTTLALPEPTNYPTAFACGTTTTTTIPLTWTDASAGQVPTGYLIKWGSGGYGSITAPVDGVAQANGAGVQNVAQGVGSYTVTGLTNNTTYYFKIWSYTNSGANINYKLVSEPQTTCATIPAPWEDFETGTKGSYALGTVTCTAGDWNLDDCLLGTSASDRKNGTKSTRVQNTGKVEMNFDITVGGIEQFTVYHAVFGGDGSSTWILEASTDGGTTWSAYTSSTQTTSSTTLTAANFTISLPAPVRIRIVKTGGPGNRVNFDDLTYTVYSGCTAPAGQASVVTSSNPNATGADLSWTAGGGSDGTLVTVRPTSTGLVAPVSGNAYAATTNYATAAQINTNNRAMYRSSGTSVSGLTGLSPETQYTATAYAYANTGNCYNLAGPASHTFWTLSDVPASHSATFTATAVAFNQIDLAFNAANLIANADGYIILRRTAAAPTGLPANATSYTVGATIGDATVAAIVTNPAATSASITGLTATTQYYFTLIPFNWNGSQPLTYNYRVAATIPLANATTLVQPSTVSDIIDDATFTYTSNIDYTLYQDNVMTNTSGNVAVWRFIIRDGGATTDADALPTILSSITFSSVAGIGNIRKAALFDGNTLVSNVSTINTGAGTIAFSGLSYSCPDNTTRTLSLRVSFNLSPIVDNEQLVFSIVNADVSAATMSTSSLFTTFSAISSSTVGNRNRLVVSGTALAFVQQPTTFVQNSNMTPAPTVGSVDVNGNRDFDFVGTVSITSTGTLNTSPQTATAVGPNGLATFSTIFHTATATGRTLQATATGQTLTNSTTFDITNIAAGSYRTTSNGTWGTTNTATWEQFTAGTWSASSAPNTNTSNVVYIRHSITTVGSFGNSIQMVVENGGFIANNAPSTCASLLIQTGGTFQVNANLTIATAGVLEVEDGANFIINFAYTSTTTSLWNGVENFHPNSNLIFYHWNGGVLLFTTTPAVTSNTYSGYTAMFGNIIIDFASGASTVTTDWTMSEYTGLGGGHPCTHQDFILRSTDAGIDIRFATTSDYGAVIGRDVIIEPSFGSGIFQLKTSGGLFFNVKRNFTASAGITRVIATSSSTSYSILNIDGDLSLTGSAILDFNPTVTSNVVDATINLKGDLTVASTALLQSSNGNGTNRGYFNFTGTGDGLSAATTQTINIASTQTNRQRNITFASHSGSYVQVINQNFEMNNQTTMLVKSGSTFDFGFNGGTALRIVEISGGATATVFTQEGGATIKITHPNGIDQGTANEGNVVTDTRTFSSTGIFHYIGKTPTQRIGDGVSTASSAKSIIVELDLLTTTLLFEGHNGTSYVSTGNIGLSNTGNGLTIHQGTVIGTNAADFNGTGILTMTGGLYRIQTNSGTIPLLSGYGSYALTGGTIEMNAAGNQVLSGTVPLYYNLAVTGANTYLTDAKTVTSAISVSNNVSITGTAVFDIQSFGMTGNAGLTMDAGRLRMAKLNTQLPELSAVSTPYALTGGVVEYYGTNATQQQLIRGGVSYFNIDVNATASNYSAPATAGNVSAGASFGVTGTLTVNSPAVFRLDAAESISGTGNFTLTSGSGFLYGSPDGIKTSGTGTSDGNLRISGTRTLPNTAAYGFVGASNMVTGNALPTTLANLYVFKTNAAALVTLPGDITITGTLTLTSGLIDPANNRVIIGNTSTNGTIAGGSSSSYIITWKSNAANGLLRRYTNGFATYFFPIGDEVYYSPTSVNFTAATATSNPYIEANVIALPHPNLGTATSFINRYWVIEPTGITDPTYNVDLNYVASDVAGVESSLYPFKFNASTGGWIGAGGSPASATMGTGSVNTGAKSLNWTNLSSFSEFTGIGDGSPLPIELLDFTVTAQTGHVDLNWSTASEINNDFFVIERSADLQNIQTIGNRVQGAGNSTTARAYSMIDPNPLLGVSYYRLVQTDFNGDKTSGDWVAVNYQGAAVNELSYFIVNRPSSEIQFGLSTVQGDANASIFDASGRIVATQVLPQSNKLVSRSISIPELAPGIYFIRIQSGNSDITRKFAW